MSRKFATASAVAAVLASLTLAAGAGAEGTGSTVGTAVCGGAAGVVCTTLGVQDYGGFNTCGTNSTCSNGPTPGNTPNNNANGYHCNNVLYLGQPSGVGTYDGTAYYTVGSPFVDPTTYNGNADTDCGNGTSTMNGSSIVLLRAVGYLNEPTTNTHYPACGDRNPCASGKSAGYIGVGGPGNPDAGGQITLP